MWPTLDMLRSDFIPATTVMGIGSNQDRKLSRPAAVIHRLFPSIGLDHVEQFVNYAFPFIILMIYSIIASAILQALQTFQTQDTEQLKLQENVHCVDADNVSFSRAFYFTSTVFLSIGYGDVVACTIAGKCLTMLYASTGVPLALFCLSRLGKPMKAGLEYLWFRCSPPPSSEAERSLPLVVGVALTLCWVLVSAAFFLFTIQPPGEYDPVYQKAYYDSMGMRYFNALYFTVISLFTIGFGDLYPQKRNWDWLTFTFVFIGLSMVSMCVAIATRKLESQFERLKNLRTLLNFVVPDEDIDFDNLSNDQQKLAVLVLNTWNRDNRGLLIPEEAGAGRQTARAMGQFAQEAVLNMWRKKARASVKTKSVGTQASSRRASATSGDVFTISTSLPAGQDPPNSIRVILSNSKFRPKRSSSLTDSQSPADP